MEAACPLTPRGHFEAVSTVDDQAKRAETDLVSRLTSSDIQFCIEVGNVLSFPADVLALKYAQHFYGADKVVAQT